MAVKTKNERGKFIVIEGGEGSGKSTMVKIAKEHFPRMLITREPGGSPFAEMIRNLILCDEAKDAHGETQFGLFWAARFDHVHNKVKPALEMGTHVLTDRFDSSSFAYQIYGQEAKHLKDLFLKMREVYLKEYTPDLYIYLQVDPKEGLRRVAERKGRANHFDARAIDFHHRLHEGYMDFLTLVPHKIINANESMGGVQSHFLKILKDVL